MEFSIKITNGSEKAFRIMEVIVLQRFELWKAQYKSFLKKFHNDFTFEGMIEVFKPRRFELKRMYCSFQEETFKQESKDRITKKMPAR